MKKTNQFAGTKRNFPLARRWRSLALLALAGHVGLSAGCIGRLFARDRGYLVTGYDVLTQPGQSVEVQVKFERGAVLADVKNLRVAVQVGEAPPLDRRTDNHGIVRAEASFDRPGVVPVTARAERWFYGGRPPQGTPVVARIFVLPPQTKLAITDIDGTVLEAPILKVLEAPAAETPPLPDAARVLRRLSQTHQVVYLTSRPDQLSQRSRNWLAKHEFPLGPLLSLDIGQDPFSQVKYKTAQIERLKSYWPHIEYAFGNRDEDARAYAAGRIRSFILTQDKDEKLPELATPVANWAQIDALLWSPATRQADTAPASSALRLPVDHLRRRTADDDRLDGHVSGVGGGLGYSLGDGQ